MAAITPERILGVWEAGRDQHPVDRALTLLLAAEPGETRARLAELSVPERDRRLLHLRADTLGPTLAVFSRCPECDESLELSVPVEDLAGPAPNQAAWEVEVEDTVLRFRLPDSRDLAVAATCVEASEARRVLGERCVLEVTVNGVPTSEKELGEAALAALARRMAEVAEEADILLDLSCPACSAHWQDTLDIAAFFWKEITVQAGRVLREVDALARAYHWSESEILGMTPARRRSYLELAAT